MHKNHNSALDIFGVISFEYLQCYLVFALLLDNNKCFFNVTSIICMQFCDFIYSYKVETSVFSLKNNSCF